MPNAEEKRLKLLPSQYYAKTYTTESGGVKTGRTVFEHCRIVGKVAKELINRFSKNLSYNLFPAGTELIAACHDIGKISPTFQKKILQSTTDFNPSTYPMFRDINPALERNWGGHPGVSQITLEATDAGPYIPIIEGQHHGYSPSVGLYRADAEVFGGANWQEERISVLKQLKEVFHSNWPHVSSAEKARIIAGLTTVADWIGSGSLFDDPEQSPDDLVVTAVDQAGFIAPDYKPGLSFSEVFGAGYIPYPIQQQFINLVKTPGIYTLEAPMGMGKTEAALYAAYQLLSSQQAYGVYFALPTQLTSNKIYERFNVFLKNILADDSLHRSLLLHGKAWLLETELGEECAPGNSWFNNRKRGLLAPFAVGTLDQALMAAMNVKHGFVRAFGLAGKVVILDEVHTYDSYTGTIIDSLVNLLRKLHCTVIILSATLSQDRRKELFCTKLHENAFPLITAARGNEKPFEKPVALKNEETIFNVRLIDTDKDASELAIKRADQGQQVLWIENTVAEAQERYRELAARSQGLGIDCGLLHSQYTVDDRQLTEERWVNLFGKAGWPNRTKQGRLLVGTQVLEQSLDIDADFLVTRFCPTDMLLQRIGRAWRHPKAPRNKFAKHEVLILAPELEISIENPLQNFGASAWVYNPYVLCRSLEVWHNLHEVRIPVDVRALIESTYSSRKEIGRMSQWRHELEYGNRHKQGKLALQQLARITLAREGTTLPESKAQTRYSEEEVCEVLLLRNITPMPEHNYTQLTLLNGEQIQLEWSRKKRTKKEWRRLGTKLMRQMVSVRPHHAPEQLPMDTLRNKLRLHHCLYLGNPEWDEAVLRLALVDETGTLRGYQGAPLNSEFNIQYRDDLGYCVSRTKEK